jgi:hypothetical protein
MKVKDHMQAFPFIEPHEDDAVKAYHPGISLRDYFAAKAMQVLTTKLASTGDMHVFDDAVAESAYAMADAMLKARETC